MSTTTDTPRRPRQKRLSTSVKAELLAPQLGVATIWNPDDEQWHPGYICPPSQPGPWYDVVVEPPYCTCQHYRTPGALGTCSHIMAARLRDLRRRRSCPQCGAPLDPTLKDNALCPQCAGL